MKTGRSCGPLVARTFSACSSLCRADSGRIAGASKKPRGEPRDRVDSRCAPLSFSVLAIIYMNHGSGDNAATWPGTMPLPSSCVLSSASSPPGVCSLPTRSTFRRTSLFLRQRRSCWPARSTCRLRKPRRPSSPRSSALPTWISTSWAPGRRPRHSAPASCLAPGLPLRALDSFPSLDTGFLFTQTPDITVSLELMKRFFLSASIIGSFANNYIQLGYKGGPNEALRKVVLGTQGITIPGSALVADPGPAAGIPWRHGTVHVRGLHERSPPALGRDASEDQDVRGQERARGAADGHQRVHPGEVLLPSRYEP